MSCSHPVGHDWPPMSSPSSVWSVQRPGRKAKVWSADYLGPGKRAHEGGARYSQVVALAPLAGFELVSEASRCEVFQCAALPSF